MHRVAVNPCVWPMDLDHNRGEVLEGTSRPLICVGQTAADGSGAPQFEGDMRGQLGLVLDNLEAVLAKAGMGLGSVVKLTVYATDVDAALRAFDLLGMRFGPAGVKPPITLPGVNRLAKLSLMIEIEALAAA